MRTQHLPLGDGDFGDFGGSYIPEMLRGNVLELEQACDKYIRTPDFQKEFHATLSSWAGRPTPLYLAENLASKLGGYRIYLKREDLCHTGSHKINNAVGQALLARRMGKENIIAETGAGQHGVATATVCALLGLNCKVFMGRADTQRQKPNVERMKILGAEVVAVDSGSKTLKDATNEALRYWINHPDDTYYLLGSVVGPHPYPRMVAFFQSVISGEIRDQMKGLPREDPDVVVACVGGGSNAMGAFYHYLEVPGTCLYGVEAAGHGLDSGKSAATIHLGTPGVLHGSCTLVMQDGDGQVTAPHSISAGLDYPGIGPQHAFLHQSGRAKYLAATDREALEAAVLLSRTEGILPALESAHAIAGLKKINIKDKVVVVCLSGRGDKDLEILIRESPY